MNKKPFVKKAIAERPAKSLLTILPPYCLITAFPWRRHDMEALSCYRTLCEGNPPVTSVPQQRASKAGLWCFHWCFPKQSVEQSYKLPLIWDAMPLMWRHFNTLSNHWLVCNNGPILWLDCFCGLRDNSSIYLSYILKMIINAQLWAWIRYLAEKRTISLKGWLPRTNMLSKRGSAKIYFVCGMGYFQILVNIISYFECVFFNTVACWPGTCMKGLWLKFLPDNHVPGQAVKRIPICWYQVGNQLHVWKVHSK